MASAYVGVKAAAAVADVSIIIERRTMVVQLVNAGCRSAGDGAIKQRDRNGTPNRNGINLLSFLSSHRRMAAGLESVAQNRKPMTVPMRWPIAKVSYGLRVLLSCVRPSIALALLAVCAPVVGHRWWCGVLLPRSRECWRSIAFSVSSLAASWPPDAL